jgi:hypothetical protein
MEMTLLIINRIALIIVCSVDCVNKRREYMEIVP